MAMDVLKTTAQLHGQQLFMARSAIADLERYNLFYYIDLH